MKSYDWTLRFREAYDRAAAAYAQGVRGAGDVVGRDDQAFLATLGCTAQELYDFVEDAEKSGEPDYGTVLLITAARRDYFLNVQGGKPSGKVVPMSTLPAKTDQVEGIEWLPRLIEKARIKLRGEMEPDLMYGCGGDRRFFKEHGIHPADFLRMAWAAGDNAQLLVDYVKAARRGA